MLLSTSSIKTKRLVLLWRLLKVPLREAEAAYILQYYNYNIPLGIRVGRNEQPVKGERERTQIESLL